jgi:hypothetical protein
MRNQALAMQRINAVIHELEEAARNNEVISMTKACKRANVSEVYIYRLIDNADEYQINNEALDRLEYAKDMILDVINQELRAVEIGADTKGCLEGDENYNTNDSPLRIARDNIRMKSLTARYKMLLPKTLGDKQGVAVNVNVNNDNRALLIKQTTQQLPNDILKALASIKLIKNEDK